MTQKFSKKQLISSKMFRDRVDLLNVLLDDNKQYTIEQVNKIVKDFLDKEAK